MRLSKKIIVLCCGIMASGLTYGQNYGDISLNYAADMSIGNGTNHPQIITGSNDQALVIWTQGNTRQLWFWNSAQAGLPQILQPAGVQVQTYDWSGPDLARSGSNIYVVYKEYGYETGAIYLQKSSDDGLTFGDTVRVDDPLGGSPQYPDVAVYQDTVWVTYMEHDAMGMHPNYVVRRSTDGGLTFEAPVAAGSLWGDEACDCCQPEIVANEKYVVLLFRNNATNIRDIKAVISTDRGATFTQLLSVDDHKWLINSCPSTGPDAALVGDVLYSTYKTMINNKSQVILNAWDLASSQLIKELVVGDTALSGVTNYPQMAVNNNHLFLTFESTGNARDIFLGGNYYHGHDISNGFEVFNVSNAPLSQAKPDVALDAVNGLHLVYADADTLRYKKFIHLENLDELGSNVSRKVITISKQQQAEWQIEGAQAITICNAAGQQIAAQGAEKSSLMIQKLAPGHYFCLIQSKEGEYLQQLIILP